MTNLLSSTRPMMGFWFSLVALFLMVDPVRASESAETLRSRNGVNLVEMSPTGTWVVAAARNGRVSGILAQRTGIPKVKPLLSIEGQISWLRWIGPDTLLASLWTRLGSQTLVFRFGQALEEFPTRFEKIKAPGQLVDALPLNNEEMLWELDYDKKNTVYRLTLDELLELGEKRDSRGRVARPKRALVTIYGSSHKWIVDRSGQPRVAWRRKETGYILLASKKSGGRLRKIYEFEDEEESRWLKPMALSADESKIIVGAYGGNNTHGLFELDPETGIIGDTVYQRDDVDIVRVRTDPITHELIAAISEPNGEAEYHYFESYRKRFEAGLDPRFPIETISITGGMPDGQSFIFFVSSATNPGEYFFRSAALNETSSIARVGSDIDRDQLSEVESFIVASEDGTQVEAYLTVPRDASGPAPLIVMPHGGPHGVRDRRVYDAFVQYLASWGFAVLQPNFRGSTGYGRDYLDAGKKEWARGIEDDIDAAVAHAIARPDIDGDRLCIVGGSYGGFSALASVVRHKDRYRCAISINGVSDIPLVSETSDFSDSKRVLEYWIDTVGDLKSERHQLIDASPAYHADKIDVPVFLIYGTQDRRVDPDHSHRMMLMLDLFGKEYDSLEIDGMRHSPGRLEWIIVMRAVRRNLTQHLLPEIVFQADPAIENGGKNPFRTKLRFER